MTERAAPAPHPEAKEEKTKGRTLAGGPFGGLLPPDREVAALCVRD